MGTRVINRPLSPVSLGGCSEFFSSPNGQLPSCKILCTPLHCTHAYNYLELVDTTTVHSFEPAEEDEQIIVDFDGLRYVKRGSNL